jgi:hypothetical protein
VPKARPHVSTDKPVLYVKIVRVAKPCKMARGVQMLYKLDHRHMPITRQRRDHRQRFADLTERGGLFIRAFCARFGLSGKRIVSIGSGTAAEEIIMAQCGATVDCIEPIAGQADLTREMAAKLAPPNSIRLFQALHQTFESQQHYDAIFSSGTQDWMSEDFRNLVPQDYLDFLKRYAADRCVLIVRFWSAEHSSDVLTTRWFAKSLAEKFRTASDFRLREYWISGTGMRALIVCTKGYGDLAYDDGFATCAARFRDTASCKYRWPADATMTLTSVERLTPFYLATRHRLRYARDGLLGRSLV